METVSPDDSVDQLVAQLRRERPELDVTPLEVLSRVTRLAKHLDRARRAAFSAHRVEQWSFDVLAALRRSGPPYALPPRTLISQTLVTSGAMTNRIDKLEAAGLVARRPDPDDRRGVLVELTPGGLALADVCLADLLARERSILRALSDGERDELARLLRVVLGPFDRAVAGD